MEKNAKDMKLKILHKAIPEIFQLLMDCVRPGCLVNVRGKQSKCYASLRLYSCSILEVKDMSGVKHGGTW